MIMFFFTQTCPPYKSLSQLCHHWWSTGHVLQCHTICGASDNPSSKHCTMQCEHCHRTDGLMLILASTVIIRVIHCFSPLQVRPRLLSIGYCLCFGTILAKTWRVYYIFTNPSPTRKVLFTKV